MIDMVVERKGLLESLDNRLCAGIRKTTAFCWVSINEPIHAPRLEHDGWPLSPLFTELFTGGLKVYQGQRKLIDLPSVWTQATGNACWEREQVSEVPPPFHSSSEFLLWKPADGTPHRIRGLRLSRDALPKPLPHRIPMPGLGSLRSHLYPSTNQDRELVSRQLTSRTVKPPPIGHFYEFLCRTPFCRR